MASRDIIKPKPQVTQIITGKTIWVPEESQFVNEITLATLKRHEDEDLAKAIAESLKYNDEENKEKKVYNEDEELQIYLKQIEMREMIPELEKRKNDLCFKLRYTPMSDADKEKNNETIKVLKAEMARLSRFGLGLDW